MCSLTRAESSEGPWRLFVSSPIIYIKMQIERYRPRLNSNLLKEHPNSSNGATKVHIFQKIPLNGNVDRFNGLDSLWLYIPLLWFSTA